MGNFLDCPNTNKESENYFCSANNLEVGISAMQGWRGEMEDDHIAINMPSRPDHLYLGVFDGHGGNGAAIYAAKNIVRCIEQTNEWQLYIENDCANIELLGNALQSAFLFIDSQIFLHQIKSNRKDSSGCTSVTAMVTPKYIVCANAGDSRCVLGTNRMVKAMSEDHKPTDRLEHARIVRAGGVVQWKRVDGDLAVSRAFGDFQYKNHPEYPPQEQKVSCFPDITVHTRSANDDVLLLACDGLWDVLTNNEAIDHVRKIYGTGETSMALIAEEMLDISLQKGSRDNISAVVVKLPGATLGPISGGGVASLRKPEAQHTTHSHAPIEYQQRPVA